MFGIKIFITVLLIFMSIDVYSEDNGQTARGVFMMLPESVFESTPEGMEEGEKERLLADGASAYWEIAEESQDAMFFSSLPFREKKIGIRIFRNSKSEDALVAYGTIDEPACVLELWRIDASGRILPFDNPDEPAITDFYRKNGKGQKNKRQSVFICLEKDGLFAKVVRFENEKMNMEKTDKRIKYVWNGKQLEKTVSEQ